MTRTTHPLVAHVSRPGSTPSPLTRALTGLPGEVRHFVEPSDCLKALPPHGEVVFLVERSALASGGLMWLILLAEARRGPVILIEDRRDRDSGAALRAGVQSVVYAPDFEHAASVQALVLDAFEQFERRTPRSPWQRGDGARALLSAATGASSSPLDGADLRAYLRDALNEFRTPLTAMAGFASILDEGIAGALNAKQSEYAHYILESCEELLELYADFRQSAYLRLGEPRGPRQTFKLGYALEEALTSVRTTRVSFRIDEHEEPVSVHGDRSALVTAVRRIVQRAAKCSTRGSVVVVRLRTVAGVQAEVAILDQGPVPTAGDIRLLSEGTVVNGDLTKSVTQVFGVGIELARAVLLEHGSVLDLGANGKDGAKMSFSLPVASS